MGSCCCFFFLKLNLTVFFIFLFIKNLRIGLIYVIGIEFVVFWGVGVLV